MYERMKSQIILEQHGFVKSRSVQTNMVNFTQKVLAKLDMGIGGCGVYRLSFIIDEVNHQLLFHKMENLDSIF